eukprot:1154188-Pelagomonas_calceolata.AAC.2
MQAREVQGQADVLGSVQFKSECLPSDYMVDVTLEQECFPAEALAGGLEYTAVCVPYDEFPLTHVTCDMFPLFAYMYPVSSRAGALPQTFRRAALKQQRFRNSGLAAMLVSRHGIG